MAYAKFEFETAFHTGKEGFNPEKRALEAKLEDARKHAYAEGLKAGRAKALQDIQAQTANLLGQIQAVAGQLLQDRHATELRLREESVMLAYLIGDRLSSALMKTHPQAEIEALILDCLMAGHDEPKIIIQVSEAMLEPIKEQIELLKAQSGFTGKIEVMPNQTLGQQDCQVTWPAGGAKRDLSLLASEVKQRIESYLGIAVELPQEPEPEPEPEQQIENEFEADADADFIGEAGLQDEIASEDMVEDENQLVETAEADKVEILGAEEDQDGQLETATDEEITDKTSAKLDE